MNRRDAIASVRRVSEGNRRGVRNPALPMSHAELLTRERSSITTPASSITRRGVTDLALRLATELDAPPQLLRGSPSRRRCTTSASSTSTRRSSRSPARSTTRGGRDPPPPGLRHDDPRGDPVAPSDARRRCCTTTSAGTATAIRTGCAARDPGGGAHRRRRRRVRRDGLRPAVPVAPRGTPRPSPRSSAVRRRAVRPAGRRGVPPPRELEGRPDLELRARAADHLVGELRRRRVAGEVGRLHALGDRLERRLADRAARRRALVGVCDSSAAPARIIASGFATFLP